MAYRITRIGKRARWTLAVALAGALALQTAIIATAALLSGGSSSYDGSSSVLLSPQHHLSDAALIAGINCAWLLAISLLAWPIARLWSCLLYTSDAADDL